MRLFGNPLENEQTRRSRRKYLDDFEIVEVPGKSGRVRKQALYRGVWTVLNETFSPQRWKLWVSLAMSLAAAAALAWLIMLNHAFNRTWQVMVPLFAALFPALHLLLGAGVLPYAGKPMRRDQYDHGIIRCCRSGLGVAVLAGISLLASLITRIVTGAWTFPTRDILYLVLCAALGLLSLGAMLLLRSVELTERENSAYEARPL